MGRTKEDIRKKLSGESEMEVKGRLGRRGRDVVGEGERVRGGIPCRENIIKCKTLGSKKGSSVLREERELESLGT